MTQASNVKSERITSRVGPQIMALLCAHKSLYLSTLSQQGEPWASYAPYAIGEDCLYVLLSELAAHAVNLQHNPRAAVLITEDEGSAADLFARLRVHYSVDARLLDKQSRAGEIGLELLRARHGERIDMLSQMGDFRLFRLLPRHGRFIKGFGRAFTFRGGSLIGEEMAHLRGGHQGAGKLSADQQSGSDGDN